MDTSQGGENSDLRMYPIPSLGESWRLIQRIRVDDFVVLTGDSQHLAFAYI